MINLTEVCKESGWHLGTAIDDLCKRGLTRRDADSFVAFVFSDLAIVRDCEPEEYLTDSQWDQLTSTGGDWILQGEQ